MANLDDIDRRLLAELQDEGRVTNVELAQRVGLTAPPCLPLWSKTPKEPPKKPCPSPNTSPQKKAAYNVETHPNPHREMTVFSAW